MSSANRFQKRQIIEIVTELIATRGVLNNRNSESGVEHSRLDELTKEAFRYYSMIVNGHNPLDIDINPNHTKTRQLSSGDNISSPSCIGCLKILTEEDIRLRMPVCSMCRKMIKTDFQMLQEIFD